MFRTHYADMDLNGLDQVNHCCGDKQRVPDHLLSWLRDPGRRRFWNCLWMCRGVVLVFLVGLMDRKRKAIVDGAFATAKESWSQMGGNLLQKLEHMPFVDD